MRKEMVLSTCEMPQHSCTVFGTFRVLGLSSEKDTDHKFFLADARGTFPAYLSKLRSAEPPEELAAYYVEGRVLGKDDARFFEIDKLKKLMDEVPDASLIPLDICAPLARAVLPQFVELIGEIDDGPLCMFIESLFGAPAFFQPYFNIPAARDTHHVEPGGNAVHCVQVARCVKAIAKEFDFGSEATQLAIAAALVHDAGKVVFADGRFRLVCVDHDQRTLEVLSPHLRELDARNHHAAEFIRHVVTYDWKTAQVQSPIAAAVHFSDVLSAMTDAWCRAFKGAPGWKSYAALNNAGRPRSYLRCVTLNKRRVH